MRFFANNLIDAAGVVITPTSEQTFLPAANVANEQIEKKWRTGTSTAGESVTFDFGSALPVNSAIIAGHNFTNFDASIEVRSSTDNFAAVDENRGTFLFQSGNLLSTFSPVNRRYWRISFIKSASGETRDIGRIFLGTYSETAEPPEFNGYNDEEQDRSPGNIAVGGQEYFDIRPLMLEFSTRFRHQPNADTTLIQSAYQRVGIHSPLFVQVETVSPLDTVHYVRFNRPFARDVSSWDGSFFWDVDLDFKQAL